MCACAHFAHGFYTLVTATQQGYKNKTHLPTDLHDIFSLDCHKKKFKILLLYQSQNSLFGVVGDEVAANQIL